MVNSRLRADQLKAGDEISGIVGALSEFNDGEVRRFLPVAIGRVERQDGFVDIYNVAGTRRFTLLPGTRVIARRS
jgi:hypothetical protein